MSKRKILSFIGGCIVMIGLSVVEAASYKRGLNDDFNNLTKTLHDNNWSIINSDGDKIILEKGKGY